MGIARPIADLFYLNRAYINTDINRLCQHGAYLNEERWELTTDNGDGIHIDKQVYTQDIYSDDQADCGTLAQFNKKYVEMNSDLMSLNLCRCAIYIPIQDNPSNWYEDELELEKLRGKYGR